jgi:hypothetical protein
LKGKNVQNHKKYITINLMMEDLGSISILKPALNLRERHAFVCEKNPNSSKNKEDVHIVLNIRGLIWLSSAVDNRKINNELRTS